VPGIEVGHTTLIRGEGKLVVGKGPVRTGVTAILPRGQRETAPVFASWFSLNGNGEMTGTAWIDESGVLDGPVLLTNTHSVGVVRDAVVEWMVRRDPTLTWVLPVVAETYDGFLNDINGMHVKKEHVFAALDGACGGPVAEGNVGGATGMRLYRFKGGIGTASRKLPAAQGGHHVGVLVQANYGQRDQLRVAGMPVGKEITDLMPEEPSGATKDGSIIVVLGTDAPLLPHQLRGLARRATLGLGRSGSVAEHTSGDLFLAFSTANLPPAGAGRHATVRVWPNDCLTPLFTAAVEATEEAIVNALVAAEDMTGINGRKVYALPHDRLRQVPSSRFGINLHWPGTRLH
jgi:L-aminopeptidase/D-esterase-like protein